MAGAATGVVVLLLVTTHSVGAVSGWSLLAIGLMNSIMFPTISASPAKGLALAPPMDRA